MTNSLEQAYKEALMKKKSKSAGGLVHPSFPAQGTPQPAHLGSQSAPPMQGDPMQFMGAGPDMSMQGTPY